MDISQHIDAGKLTSCYVSGWSEEVTLNFGKDQIKFKVDETQLRELAKDIAERIKTIDEERAAEAEKLLSEKEENEQTAD